MKRRSILTISAILAVSAVTTPILVVSAEQTLPTLDEQNANLFVPGSYEEYLSLSSPTDVAVSENHIAIADGELLYVYDRAEKSYSVYEHDSRITKVQFDDSENIYFADNRLALQRTSVQLETPVYLTGSSTFYIHGNSLYNASVNSGNVSLRAHRMDGAWNEASFDEFHSSLAPSMTFTDGKVLCGLGANLYTYTEDGLIRANSYLNNAGDIAELRSLSAVGESLFYTTGDGLYRTDVLGNCTRIKEASNFYALSEYDGYLYIVTDRAVLQADVSEDFRLTGYEISADSDSENRLTDVCAMAAKGDLVVLADKTLNRVTLHDVKDNSFITVQCDYTPEIVSTDGNIVAVSASDREGALYVYDKMGEFLYGGDVVEHAVAGIACSFGRVYFVTELYDYMLLTKEGVTGAYRSPSQAIPQSLSVDLWGNLFVSHENGAVVRFTPDEFTDRTEAGTLLELTLPVGASGIEVDFRGNVYCTAEKTIYKNGEPFAEVENEKCVFGGVSTSPSAFTLGFERKTVYLAYGSYAIQTTALDIPSLDDIPTENISELFTRRAEAIMVNVESSAVGIEVSLADLAEEDVFTMLGYAEFKAENIGILLGSTEEFNLVALFEDHEYDVYLFRKTECSALEKSLYWTEKNVAMNITSHASSYLFPCLVEELKTNDLVRLKKVVLLGVVSLADTADYDYAYVLIDGEDELLTSYLPLSYLTDILPLPSASAWQTGKFDLGEGAVFTNGATSITLNGENDLFYLADEDGLWVRYTGEEGSFFAVVEKDTLVQTPTPWVRIVVIISLSVVELLIIGGYFYLYPKKSKNKFHKKRI